MVVQVYNNHPCPLALSWVVVDHKSLTTCIVYYINWTVHGSQMHYSLVRSETSTSRREYKH